MIFQTDDLGADYPYLLQEVKEWGNIVPSRIGETKEILNLRLELMNPRRCIVSRKGFSRKFMDEEILQLLAGKYDHDRLHAISPVAASLITEATAYGPRTADHLEFVAEELKNNPTSRRAVVYVGRHDDLAAAKYDSNTAGEMPCTMTWQFHLRKPFLHMTVNMRSWDLVWGLTYDIPSFVAVQLALCDALGAIPGTYVHNAGSGHIYDKHYDLEAHSVAGYRLNVNFLAGSIEETRSKALELMEGGVHAAH